MKYFDTNTFTKMNGSPSNNNPTQIFVHHSGGTDANPLADTSEHTAKGMELWHLGKGWDGLGYHYVIHKNGDVWRGRPEHRNGAHAVGYNTKSIGICLAGNFDATLPTQAQIESLKELMLEVKSRHDISAIRPHRSVANKTCYGNRLGDTWAADLLNDVPSTDQLGTCESEKAEIKKLKGQVKLLVGYIIKLISK